MVTFSSKREYHFWLYALLVTFAIFATIPFAGILMDWIGEHSIIGVGLFLLGCLMVLATILSQGFRFRPGGLEIAVGIGISAAYLLVFVRMAIPTERSHLIEYSILAIFIYEALLERRHNGRKMPMLELAAIFLTMLIGLMDECAQQWVPDRVFDPLDMVFNTIAAVLAIGGSWIIRKIKD